MLYPGTKRDIRLLMNAVSRCGLAAKLGGGPASFRMGGCGSAGFTPIFSG